MHTAPGMHVIICFTHSCSLLLSTGILYHKLRGNNKKPTVFYAFTCNTYSRIASFEVGCRTTNSLISTFFLCPVKCLITSFIHIMKADLCMFNETAAYAYGQRFLQLWQTDGTNTPRRVSITCCSCASSCIQFRYMLNSYPPIRQAISPVRSTFYISCLNSKLAAATFSVKVS